MLIGQLPPVLFLSLHPECLGASAAAAAAAATAAALTRDRRAQTATGIPVDKGRANNGTRHHDR